MLPMLPTDVLSALLLGVLAGIAGAGFALIIQTSPLGRLTFKPFSCRTCCSGWGSIGFLLLAFGEPLRHAADVGTFVALCVSWAALSFVGIGVAHLLLGLSDGGSSTAMPDFDAPTDVGPIDTP